MSKKRKIDRENRKFNNEWELEYFFIENDGKLLFLICNENIANVKKQNIERHYEKKHENYKEFKGKLRETKLEELKKSLKLQQIFVKDQNVSHSSVKASYVISELIANKSKPYIDRQFIKECMIKTAQIVCLRKSIYSQI